MNSRFTNIDIRCLGIWSPRTFAIVKSYIPSVLVNIVFEYFKPVVLYDGDVASHGCYEASDSICKIEDGLAGACRGGYLEIARLMIAKGASCFNWGLNNACEHGHIELAKLMIEYGATCISCGSFIACQNGHREITELLIAHGAHCGAVKGCACGHRKI